MGKFGIGKEIFLLFSEEGNFSLRGFNCFYSELFALPQIGQLSSPRGGGWEERRRGGGDVSNSSLSVVFV